MIRFLLDASVLVAACQSAAEPRLTEWLREQPDEALFASSVTLGELQRAILEMPAERRRRDLLRWFTGPGGPATLFAGRMFDFDARAAAVWAANMAERALRPSPTCDLDAMQAAIAAANDCIIVTTAPAAYGRARTFNPLKSNVV